MSRRGRRYGFRGSVAGRYGAGLRSRSPRAVGAGTPARAGLAAIAVAVGYAVVGALAATAVGGLATPVGAGLTLGGFALCFAGIGAAVESRLARKAAGHLPLLVRDAL